MRRLSCRSAGVNCGICGLGSCAVRGKLSGRRNWTRWLRLRLLSSYSWPRRPRRCSALPMAMTIGMSTPTMTTIPRPTANE